MQIAKLYKALADESRIRLVHILERGYFNVQELTSVLQITQPTISHHLRSLQIAGLTKSKKEGTWVYYTLCSKDESPLAFEIADSFLKLCRSPALNGDSKAFESDTKVITQIINKRRDKGKDFFNAVAPHWRDIRATATTLENPGDPKSADASYLDVLAEKIGSAETLLELGCGSGALLEKLLPRSGKTIGVDFSEAMLNEAKKLLGARASGVDLRLGYLEHLPLADATVETAAACMVFHHLASPKEVLLDVARVLLPGGRLLITDLTEHSNEYMRERFADLWLGFSREEFSGWLSGAGFEVKTSTEIGEKGEVFFIEAVLSRL